jgi:hypothetical protein
VPIPLGQESARILLPVLLMAGLIRKYEYVKSMSDVLKALDLHKFNQMISFSTENALLM